MGCTSLLYCSLVASLAISDFESNSLQTKVIDVAQISLCVPMFTTLSWQYAYFAAHTIAIYDILISLDIEVPRLKFPSESL